jgi:protein TonB
MNHRLLLPFTLSGALHAAAVAAVLGSRSVEEERAVFTIEVALTDGTDAAPGAAAAGPSATEVRAVAAAEPATSPTAVSVQDAAPGAAEPEVRPDQAVVSVDSPPTEVTSAEEGLVAVPRAAVRETSETARSSRRRQVVAAAPAKLPHVESPREPGPSIVAPAAPSAPIAAEPAGKGQTGATLASAVDGWASGSSEPSAGRAEAVHRVAPAYPMAARRRGLEGSVLLRVRLDAEGRPEDVAVLTGSGSEMLDSAARDAVLRWRFRAGTAGSVDVPITFRLRGAEAMQITDAAPGREQ